MEIRKQQGEEPLSSAVIIEKGKRNLNKSTFDGENTTNTFDIAKTPNSNPGSAEVEFRNFKFDNSGGIVALGGSYRSKNNLNSRPIDSRGTNEIRDHEHGSLYKEPQSN